MSDTDFRVKGSRQHYGESVANAPQHPHQRDRPHEAGLGPVEGQTDIYRYSIIHGPLFEIVPQLKFRCCFRGPGCCRFLLQGSNLQLMVQRCITPTVPNACEGSSLRPAFPPVQMHLEKTTARSGFGSGASTFQAPTLKEDWS